jgi:hypothetical protein
MLIATVLNMMAVFVEHQRKGVGKLLLDWGLQLADNLRALVSFMHIDSVLIRTLTCGSSVHWREP